jgi:hypothetical protein
MNKYDTIINTILVILILTIIIVILFGCHYKGCRYFEKFENSSQEDEKKKKDLLDNIKKDSGKNSKSKKDEDNSLSSFEKTVLEGLSTGSLNTDGLAKLIKEEKFTNMNLDNIINYVEKTKGNV